MMDQSAPGVASPYMTFSRAEWAALRADEPLTLTEDDLNRLKSLNDPISIAEVEHIYLPLTRLLTGHGAPVTDHARLVDTRLRDHRRRCERILAVLDGARLW